MPYWGENQGSISAVLAHHERIEVFERVTGLPAALALVLETVPATTPDEVEALFAALTPGKDIGLVPLQWVREVLSDTRYAWSDWLQDPELDALRMQWLALTARHLAGEAVADIDWAPFLQYAAARENRSTLGEELENNVAQVLSALSPPPNPAEVSAWGSAKIQLGFALSQILQIEAGWSIDERATPGKRYRWFSAHQEVEPGKQFSDERLAALRAEWLADNQAFAAKEEEFYHHYAARSAAQNTPLREALFALLRTAPRFVVNEAAAD